MQVQLTALTHRQCEIAELVAQGLTNKQIARRLVLAEGTVANHVFQMLRRLEFQSRAQIAAWVASGGVPLPEPEWTGLQNGRSQVDAPSDRAEYAINGARALPIPCSVGEGTGEGIAAGHSKLPAMYTVVSIETYPLSIRLTAKRVLAAMQHCAELQTRNAELRTKLRQGIRDQRALTAVLRSGLGPPAHPAPLARPVHSQPRRERQPA